MIALRLIHRFYHHVHSRIDHHAASGALFHLLRNRIYLGMIVYAKKVHPDMHKPIVGKDLFDAAQIRLDANTMRHVDSLVQLAQSTLVARIFDYDGEPMSPAAACGQHGKQYRYCVCTTATGALKERGRRRPASHFSEIDRDQDRRNTPSQGPVENVH